MTDTHGFKVLVEAGEPVLLKVLQGAWKSADCPDAPGDEGRIPEYRDIPGGTAIGSYTVSDGQVQIPRDELGAEMAPEVNGVRIKLGLKVQVEIQSPPVPSAGIFDMTADVKARIPVGLLSGTKNVGMLLDGLPRSNVTCELTSGDPLAPKLQTLIGEYIHRAYENWTPSGPIDAGFPTIPHYQDDMDIVWNLGVGSITVDAHTELFDDPTDPARRVEVTFPAAGRVRITIPMYLRMYNIRRSGAAQYLDLRDPMGIVTRMIIEADLESPPGSYTVRLDTATVTSDAISPATGTEGANYTHNKASIPVVSLDTLLQNQIASRGTDMVHAIGQATVAVPTVDQIEQAIGGIFHSELEARSFVAIWTPEAAGENFSVDDVTTRATSEVLVIALNETSGSDLAAVTDFIPAGREFAIALDGPTVQGMIDKARSDNGFADSDLPKRMHEDDKDVDLNSLDVSLANGSIRMTGEVTVIDAVAGSIDVDADFRVDVGLHWDPDGALNSDGVQKMEHHIIGEPDVDPEGSVAFWIIAIILAVISFGAGSVLVGIIIIVVALIVSAIAENVGGHMLVDGVSGAVSGITGWPPDLSRIGTVTAVFQDPIVIEASGLLLSGVLEVVSSCEDVEVLAADSGGSYTAQAASPLSLQAQHTSGVASYAWTAGDGSPTAPVRDLTHTYVASGRYVAKHSLKINEPGGATSRHFADVEVRNVPPTVDAGPDITVNEGEVVTLVGHFEDVEYPDTHESMWTFGDAQPPDTGTLQETNDPPKAVGTSTVEHAWCDNGTYEVTLRVRDQNGGVGTDTRTVRVLNVAPTVDAGPELFAYPCTVITLAGSFTDPGWCDTHQASWDFGDCSPVQRATVREKHEPPQGTGDAIASHVFDQCGTYLATCTVVDDDGGVGGDATVIRVIDVVNKDFEGGFRKRTSGAVANDWEPYTFVADTALATAGHATGEPAFFSHQEVVHSGQRSQGMVARAATVVGIRQKMGANPGWDYQITGWYALAQGMGGRARLGIDPTGDTNPSSPMIIWDAGDNHRDWSVLIVRATATARAVTIFLEVTAAPTPIAGGGNDENAIGAEGYFDDVQLIAVQPFCPEEPEVPARPPRDIPDCVDFRQQKRRTEFPAEFTVEGFGFHMMDGQAGRIVTYGEPEGEGKLELRSGLLVDIPFPCKRVTALVSRAGSGPVTLTAVDSAGAVVDRADSDEAQGVKVALEVAASGIVRVQLTTMRTESGLIELCAHKHGTKSHE